tara:strand:+ start:190 stop:309 length:120 start_codon:yes stop_codon:yes gene_type:complete
MHFINDVDYDESEDDVTVEIEVYEFVLFEPSFWKIVVHN